MKTGKALENLVKTLEKALADKDFVTVEARKRLRDRTTGRPREHDVVLTIKQQHHEMLIAIECRDRSRPITVNQVEGFWKKCQDTGIDKGIIVSSKGFYKTAKSKASFLGIRCLTLEEATSFSWLRTPGIIFLQRNIRRANWTLIPKGNFEQELSSFVIRTEEGKEITRNILMENIRQRINELELPFGTEGSFQQKMVFDGEGLFVEDKSTGKLIPLKSLEANVEYEIKSESPPIQFMKYVDKDKETEITDVAIANMKNGDFIGKLLVVYKENKGGRIVIVPKPKSAK